MLTRTSRFQPGSWHTLRRCARSIVAMLGMSLLMFVLALALGLGLGTPAFAATTSTTTLTANPSPAFVGQNVTLTATVTGTSPTGSVTFMDGATNLGTGTIASGKASLVKSFATTGAHSLTAVYAGDTGNASSTSSATNLTVNPKASSSTALAVNINPAAAGQSVTLTATVTATSPSGSVTFMDGATSLGPATLSAGKATLVKSFASVGAHSLSAVYAGDTGNNGSTSAALSLTVTQATTSTTLTAAPNPVAVGAPLVLTAQVTGASPSGNVSFSDGATPLGTIALASGQASLSVSLATTGSHSLTASYAGDANNKASTSTAANVQVGATSSTTPPGNMIWLYGYDAEGNRTTATDPNGNQSKTAYDPLQRPATLTQPAPGAGQATPITTLGYDGRDQLTKVTDPRSLVTNYTVDGLGNVKTTASPDSGTATSTYDAAGNLLTSKDARGKTSTYTYDSLNRVKSISYATGTATVFEYDGGATPVPNAIGKVSKITDESGSTSYVYDGFGRLITKTQVTGSKTFKVTYAWGTTGSATGKLTAITYPSGNRVNYAYDTAGRINAISLNPVNSNGVGTSGTTTPILSGITYNAASHILG